MKRNDAEQFEFPLTTPDPLEVELEKRWKENERAQAHQWTPEAFACLWWSGGVKADPDGWAALPSYERRGWIHEYEFQRSRAESCGVPMTPAWCVAGMREESFQHTKRLAESWAEDIRKAFKEGRPCPIRPEPAFAYVLDWAFQIATVPRECLAAAETPDE